MIDDDDVMCLCRGTQALRRQAEALAVQTIAQLEALRELLAERAGLLQWTAEVMASMPSVEETPPAAALPRKAAQSVWIQVGRAPANPRPLG